MAICDRVAVMQAGVLHQCGLPGDLLAHPATPFVGTFVLQANSLIGRQEGALVHTDVGSLRLMEPQPAAQAPAAESSQVLILPEGLRFEPDPEGEAWVLGREFLGQDWVYRVQCGSQRLRLRLPVALAYNRGQRGRVRLKANGSGWLFPGGQLLQAAPAS